MCAHCGHSGRRRQEYQASVAAFHSITRGCGQEGCSTTDRVKGVTAIILGDPKAVNITRREGKDWIGLRIEQGGKTTKVYAK